DNASADGDGDVCGICRVPYEGCCPTCKMPGDDCPLIWGRSGRIYHLHCLLKWLGTPTSKQRCPMDCRPWITSPHFFLEFLHPFSSPSRAVTAERKVNKNNNHTGSEAP
ncbi:anaphase-promoting complex subunit 11 RING-H2 finger-domain-containing protein, partial [Pisolithus albus]